MKKYAPQITFGLILILFISGFYYYVKWKEHDDYYKSEVIRNRTQDSTEDSYDQKIRLAIAKEGDDQQMFFFEQKLRDKKDDRQKRDANLAKNCWK